MLLRLLLRLTLCLSSASALAVITITARSSPTASLVRRVAVPTFTFGPKEQYIPSQASDPEPAGTYLQIFPTGIYDEFPDDGITISLGADLRKQITDIMAKSCNGGSYTQECQDSLVPLLQNTDLATHTKRFVVVTAIGILSLMMAVAGIVWEMNRISSTSKEVPANIKLNNADLAQIQSMSGVKTFAAVAAEVTTTLTLQLAATSTSPDHIIIETLSVDQDNHKAGDVVYRIPKDDAARINDFLAMTGIHETQDICKAKSFKRVDGIEECLQHIQRHAIDLADAGPSNLLQVAQQNIPSRPASGQAIGLAVENLATQGIPIIIPVYRAMYEHAPQRPNFDLNWSPVILAKGAVAIAIAANAALYIGESVVEIWVSKDKLIPDLKEDNLACPRDILCIADDCKGQEEFSNIAGTSPYCKKISNFGCKCRPIVYGYSYEVEGDYMDKQYEWLEELIKKSSMPSLEANCDSGNERLKDAPKKVSEYIENFCKNHSDLKSSFNDVQTLEAGFTFGLYFKKTGGDCAMDCKTLFSTFVESDSCITDWGMQKNGEIRTECGTGSYVGYVLG